jgi:two-component system alkaline phosphatase synthesis response regulator PhoP
MGGFVSSKQKDNLLDGTCTTVHTDVTQSISITKRILVVDDEEGIVKLVKMYLEHYHYEVITASDGQEGLERAKTDKPDLIVLDLMLPKINGYKVCGLLKKDTKYAKTPIILFTAKAQEKDVKLGEEVGADAYITKPFEPEVLLSKIEELIGK